MAILTPWLRVAKNELGVTEIPGAADEPRITEYMESTSHPIPPHHVDEIPWCSAFVNWVMEHSGYPGTGSAWSQSWKNWGIPLTLPKTGAIVIFSWGGNSGHVGFVWDWDEGGMYVLGGNQSDSVNITYFRYTHVVGYRWPEGA